MKFFKRLLAVFVTVTIVLIAALLLLALNLDPNDYKEKIEAMAEQATGHKLNIEGEIKLVVFPALSMDVAQISIDNPPQFEGHLVSVERLSAKLKLLPLLQKRLEIGKVTLIEPQLMLHTSIDRRSNWEGKLSADAAASDTSSLDHLSMFSGFSLAGISIVDASVVWIDERTREHIQAEQLRLEIGALASGKPVDFSSQASVRDHLRGFSVAVDIGGAISIEPSPQRVNLEKVAAAVGFQRDDASAINAKIAADVSIDLEKDTATFRKLRLSAGGARVDADGSIAGLFSQSRTVAAKINSNTFNLRDLAGIMNVALPATSSDRAFQKFAVAGDFTVEFDSKQTKLRVRPAEVTLDDSQLHIQGDVAWMPALQANLTGKIDRLDAGLYLPPGDNAGAAVPLELPLDDLRVDIDARNGKINIPMLAATIFGGKVNGDASVEMGQTSKPTEWSARGSANGVDIERVVAAFSAEDTQPLRGRSNLSWRLRASGDNAPVLVKSLGGVVELSLEDGSLKDPKLAKNIERVVAFFEKRPPRASGDELIFRHAEASFQLKQGVAENRDLEVDMPLLHLQGAGDIDLTASSVDYQLRVGLRSEAGKAADEKTYIPIKITGSFDDLKYSLDFQEVLRQTARKQLGDELNEKKKEFLEDKKRAVEDALKEKVGSIFKGIKKLPF